MVNTQSNEVLLVHRAPCYRRYSPIAHPVLPFLGIVRSSTSKKTDYFYSHRVFGIIQARLGRDPAMANATHANRKGENKPGRNT